MVIEKKPMITLDAYHPDIPKLFEGRLVFNQTSVVERETEWSMGEVSYWSSIIILEAKRRLTYLNVIQFLRPPGYEAKI